MVLARVDGTAYTLFGSPKAISGSTIATQKSITFTSTHTLITLQAGSVIFTLDFFSPVSPKNLVRQSLPYSYLTVSAIVSKGFSPSIDILSAVDDTWTAQVGSVVSGFQKSDGANIFTLKGKTSYVFSQSGQGAAWGTSVFASSASSAGDTLSYQSGPPAIVEASFVANGSLTNSAPTYTPGGLVAHAHQLGKVSTSASALFVVGLYQENVINYFDGRVGKNLAQSPYFRTKYLDIPSSVVAFINDYDAALSDSHNLDNQVVALGLKISSNYTDLLEASVRQA